MLPCGDPWNEGKLGNERNERNEGEAQDGKEGKGDNSNRADLKRGGRVELVIQCGLKEGKKRLVGVR